MTDQSTTEPPLEPEFDLSGPIPLRRSRFRRAYVPNGCDVCRAQATSNPYSIPEVDRRGWTTIRRCALCGGLWMDTDRSSIAISPDQARRALQGNVEAKGREGLPPTVLVIAEPSSDRDASGRLTLPPLPQGLESGIRGGILWQLEALAFVADVLLGQSPGTGEHRFTMQHRRELVNGILNTIDDYGMTLDVPLDWERLVSEVDLGQHFTPDPASTGQRFVRAIGSNSLYYSVRGPGEIVTTHVP